MLAGVGSESSSSTGDAGDLLVDFVGRRPPSFPRVFLGEGFDVVVVVVVVVDAAG